MSLQLRLSLSRALGWLGVWKHLEGSVFKEPRGSCVAKIKMCFSYIVFAWFPVAHSGPVLWEQMGKGRGWVKGVKLILEIPALLFTAWVHQIFDMKRPVAKTVFESLLFIFICLSFHSSFIQPRDFLFVCVQGLLLPTFLPILPPQNIGGLILQCLAPKVVTHRWSKCVKILNMCGRKLPVYKWMQEVQHIDKSDQHLW